MEWRCLKILKRPCVNQQTPSKMEKAIEAFDTLIKLKEQELVEYMLKHGDIISDYLNIYKEWQQLQDQKQALENLR